MSTTHARKKPVHLYFSCINDAESPEALPALFDRYWPAYQKWIRRAASSDSARCTDQLRLHMPELIPAFESLLARFGGGRDIERFLALFDPPRVVRACSQAVFNAESGPVLLRTYDHHPALFDAVLLESNWTGMRTLAMGDCIWGALDGINERGLAVALAFGGRNSIGPGFAAPLIVRYLLETCATTAEAKKALARLPVYMPYTFALLDAKGKFLTAFLGPDRDAAFVTRRCSANHQRENDWPEYARQTRSHERLQAMQALLKAPSPITLAREAFTRPPIWRDGYDKANGTLYAAEYNPSKPALTLRWPQQSRHFVLGKTPTGSFEIALASPPTTPESDD